MIYKANSNTLSGIKRRGTWKNGLRIGKINSFSSYSKVFALDLYSNFLALHLEPDPCCLIHNSKNPGESDCTRVPYWMGEEPGRKQTY